MPKTEKVEIISKYRLFKRNYTPEELLGEITNLIKYGGYEDFMFVAAGDDGLRSTRIGSSDRNLRIGDLLHLLEFIKSDILAAGTQED